VDLWICGFVVGLLACRLVQTPIFRFVVDLMYNSLYNKSAKIPQPIEQVECELNAVVRMCTVCHTACSAKKVATLFGEALLTSAEM
jgi:hypothetical protein